MSASSLSSGRGHSHERFQGLQMWRPHNTVSAVDLKGAADASLAKWWVPAGVASIQVVAMGFHHAAAGGAQTTAGTMVLEIGGTDVENAAGTDFSAASVVSHTADTNVETELNSTTDTLAAAPSYPTASSGQLIEAKVGTQGVGAGDQTVMPYLLVRQLVG
jgi:hypothetical protein